MPEVKASDALMTAAESVIALAKSCGIKLTLTEVYNKDTLTELAFISAFLRQSVERAIKQPITVINQ